jgi:hypothetical protein
VTRYECAAEATLTLRATDTTYAPVASTVIVVEPSEAFVVMPSCAQGIVYAKFCAVRTTAAASLAVV